MFISMHRFTRWIALALLLGIGVSADGALVISPAKIEVGVVASGASRTIKLSLTNNGSGPLKVLAAEPECTGCTHVDFSPTTLAPGKSLEVPVTFTPPADDKGSIRRSVTFKSDDLKTPAIKIPLEAYVTASAGIWPPELAPDQPRAPGEDVTFTFDLVNVSGQALTPLYAMGPVDGPKLAVPHDPIPAGGKVTLSAKWHLPAKTGLANGQLTLYVDHPAIASLTVPYHAMVQSAPSTQPHKGTAAATVQPPVQGAILQEKTIPSPAAGPVVGDITSTPVLTAAPTTAVATQPVMVDLDLKESLPLKDFVDIVGTQLKLNLIYDETSLNAPVSIRLSGPLPSDALLPLLKTLLQAKGLALVPTDRPEIWRIVTSHEAQTLSEPGKSGTGPAQIVTEFIAPKSVDLETAAGLLRGFSTPGVGQITTVPSIKSLIVTDYASQLSRLHRLLDLIDKPEEPASVQVVPLKAAEAGPLADRITKLLDQIGKSEGRASFGNVFISPAEDGSSGLVLVGPETALTRVRDLVKQFDTAPSLVREEYAVDEQHRVQALDAVRQVLGTSATGASPDGSPRITTGPERLSVVATEGQQRRIKDLLAGVLGDAETGGTQLKPYRIQNRSATEVYATLTRLLGDNRGAALSLDAENKLLTTNPQGITHVGNPPGSPAPSAPADAESHAPNRSFSTSAITITVDEGTNTLLIAASSDTHRRLQSLIHELDRKQAQVLLEVMMVSVADSDSFAAAVDAALKVNIDGATVAIGTNQGLGTGDFVNGRTPVVTTGFNAAIFNPASFSVFMNALQQTNKARVLSVPQVLALDNKAALLSSIQQQPFTSVNASTTVATTSFGGFAEAGTTLEITPHIAPADYLNLEYRLEVSSFTGSSSGNGVPPPKRSDSITSFVSVPDGSTVVLGGLRSSNVSSSVAKVPGLGEIPILGWIGRNQNDTNSTAAFYVFVRPTILRASNFEDLKTASVHSKNEVGVADDYPQTRLEYLGSK